jgi:two-component system response regulator
MDSSHILLIEDNEDDVLLTLRAFRQSKMVNVVDVARDGEEAVEYLFADDAPQRPGLVLLDLQLPKVDGHEILKRIREDERTRLIPVIVLTSSREERDLVESYSSGANSFIRKHVDWDQFVEAIPMLGMYGLVLNEPPPQCD